MLVVSQTVRLRHGDPAKGWSGDHSDVHVPPGSWRVTIDREYDSRRHVIGGKGPASCRITIARQTLESIKEGNVAPTKAHAEDLASDLEDLAMVLSKEGNQP